MTQFAKNNQYGMVTAASILALALILGGWIKFDTNTSQAKEGVKSNLIGQNTDLRYVFRNVSKEVLPSIVSIHTRTEAKVVKNETGKGTPNFRFGGDPLLKEFFKNDPRMEEFFNSPNSKQTPSRPKRGQGSGFIVDSTGIIVTNNHVVADADTVIVKLNDGRQFKATSVKTDPRTDLAVVTIDAQEELKAIPLGDSDKMQIGDWVLALGNPFGLDMTVTSGIVSAKGRGPGINEREDFIQTDAAVNPGNSGGPLVNLDGEVVGINSAITSRNGGNDGVAFAIPVNMAKWVVNQLIENGEVKRAYIGVVIQPVTSDLASHLKTKFGVGALVNQVASDSPAEDAGLESGDVILKLNNEKVNNTRQLQGIVEMLTVGKTYPLEIIRNGDRKELSITMKAMPEDFTLSSRTISKLPKADVKTGKPDKLGLQVTELTEELAGQLKLKVGQGVVVKSVENASLAANGGIKPGDVIERVGNKNCQSIEDFEELVNNASLQEGVMLLVRTRNVSRFIVLKKQ